jgi:hypothetical protein
LLEQEVVMVDLMLAVVVEVLVMEELEDLYTQMVEEL